MKHEDEEATAVAQSPEPGLPLELSDAGRLSDAEVVARVLAGDTGLFELLLRRHNQRLYRVARSVLRDEAEAEDVMQQTYVEAYSHLGQWEGRAQFGAWLTRIAFHEALARARKRRRERTAGSTRDPEKDAVTQAKSSDLSPEQQAFRGELRGHLESAIDSLPLLYRVAFVMREIEGLSTADAAAFLGLREDAVKTRLSRARALLREDLSRRMGAGTGSAFSFERMRCDRVVATVFARLHLADEWTPS
jgi:RNA polymerase sigma-70 factor (ECF subfamily)